ncbi:hypothetical protein ASG66_15355 [Bacillus sp. Leaf406]|nr:hypothetical protein ASG66_15355 [Bacillus sp. Leaf406]
MLKKVLKRTFQKKKKKGPKLKHKLEIIQNDESVSISGSLYKEDYTVESLWLASRHDFEKLRLISKNEREVNQFSFSFGIPALIEQLSVDHDGSAYDWYIKVRRDISEISEDAYAKLEEKATFLEKGGVRYASYYIRLGRFSETRRNELGFVEHGGHSGIVYLTKKGNLSFLLDGEPKTPVKIQIDRLFSHPGSIEVTGKLFTRNSAVKHSTFLLRGRKTGKEYLKETTLEWDGETVNTFGLNRYEYRTTFDFRELCKGENLPEDIYDLFLKLELHDYYEPKIVRVGRPAFKGRFLIKNTSYSSDDNISIINPYYTFKASNLSFEVYEYRKDTFDFLKSKLRFAWFHRVANKSKDVWIVGERPYKAQDTGYYFFKYMRENHPEKNVYYVIEEHSPERKNVEPLGNVITFKSKEHIWYSLISTKIISSHHPDYLYPVRTKRFQKAVKATKVFLQHGVMGTKNMVANYGKTADGFDTDLFMVSSDFEKRMIVNDFGYKPEEVFVTGLSRFDSLLKEDLPLKDQILIIPTWRDWITTDESFMESDYYERYKELVFHPGLHSFAKEHGMEIIFCLHPNMQNFTSYFSHAPITLINQGDVDVQRLLKESKLMITDYSSVGFDFSFLRKPIIYYQFDRPRFIGKRPSHLDLDNDLPGSIAFDLDEVLHALTKYGENQFKMLPDHQKRSDQFIKYRDLQSSERIYSVIQEADVKTTVREKVAESPVYQMVFKKFRKSKYYFPTMKKFYSIARRVLPIDDNLILFESGVGKQYADSPRYIYEEIFKRGLPYKKVWVYNKSIPVTDESLIQVKRLSPQYYYYLAKSRFWVNNQNFPTYIKKPKGTTYLQTWHGTPLKKMLFDIENIQGRSEGYLDRVHGATKQWDHLISPSPYASEAFRSAFRYTGDIMEVGYPRNDIFHHDNRFDIQTRVKRKLGLPQDKKVILYAPTFRDNETKGKNKFVFDIKMDLHRMQEQLGEDFIILLRMHVVISNKLRIPEELRSFVYNVSEYPEIQELSLISDVLITDYSSVMFDFANTGQPILFFTYDFDEYKNDIRGFYIDFEHEAPGPLLYDTDGLIDSLKRLNEVKAHYHKKYDEFQNKYCYLEDGNAASRVVDRLFDQ